jgi:hypothetical protein
VPARSVAVDGDVSATAGTAFYTGATSGTWTAGPITATTYENLESGGKKVIWKAECTFSFTGENSGGSAVTGTEKVTLTATTKLLDPGQHVLVDGDSKTGGDAPPTFDNKLTVSAAGPLETS